MGRQKAHTPEEIVAKLRQAEVLQAGRIPKPGRSGSGGTAQMAKRVIHRNSDWSTRWGLVSVLTHNLMILRLQSGRR